MCWCLPDLFSKNININSFLKKFRDIVEWERKWFMFVVNSNQVKWRKSFHFRSFSDNLEAVLEILYAFLHHAENWCRLGWGLISNVGDPRQQLAPRTFCMWSGMQPREIQLLLLTTIWNPSGFTELKYLLEFVSVLSPCCFDISYQQHK